MWGVGSDGEYYSIPHADRYTHITQGVWWIKQRSYIEFIGLLLVRGTPLHKKGSNLQIVHCIGQWYFSMKNSNIASERQNVGRTTLNT